MKSFYFQIIIIISLLLSNKADAIVNYEKGAIIVRGVQLLQDRDDPKQYFYVPTYPRLSMKPDSTLEFLCLKYVGLNRETSGGLFHALIQFTLPIAEVELLEKELRKKVSGAKIAGPVPMMQPQTPEGESFQPTFEIVSAILSNKDGKDVFTRSLVSSGYAPLTAGSKAAVAALLNQEGATLLWNSLTGPTSDVSVTVHGYYEAAVQAYNATVTADMKTVYQHLSKFQNNQKEYTREQIRQSMDSLYQNGAMKVEVFDRSSTVGGSTKQLDAILDIVTSKLTELMFDNKTGWAQVPKKVDAMDGVDIPGKQKKDEKTVAGQAVGEMTEAITTGALDIATGGIFSIATGFLFPKKDKYNNPQYVTDNQYILKDIKDVRQQSFYLNLSKTTTIKVPVHTSGNIGGIYQTTGVDNKYFRIVDMNDPAFLKREVNFQIDGEFVDAFDDLINFVTVNFRKRYSNNQADETHQLFFNSKDIKDGIIYKTIVYPRLGIETSDWLDYEYQIAWSLKGDTKTVYFPTDENVWAKSNTPAVSLVLPFKKMIFEIDGDRSLFLEKNYVTASVVFATTLAGKKTVVRKALLRATDTESTLKTSLYHDPQKEVVFQTTWHSNEGEVKDALKVFDSGYINIVPPGK